ncbi:AMP-binding protein [Streptomyces sp. B21-105]|uniref:AMP-binding protein n=1 Tax=Streptomyces sp. B21-105 TaxID=3039417 RepID=UPI002FF22AA1
MHLFQALRARARERPRAVAHVVAGGQTLTFDAWHRRACAQAERLSARGVGPGTPVGLRFTAEEVIDAASAMVAVQLLAAVPVFLPQVSDPATVARGRSRTGVDLVLPNDWPVGEIGGEPCSGHCRLERWAERSDIGAEIAAVVQTSGATGNPRGVAITHQDAAYQTRGGWTQDVLLAASAVHTVDGAMHLVAPLLDGRKVITLPRFSAGAFWQTLRKQKPTYLKLVPAMIRLLDAEETDLPPQRTDVRKVRIGSAAVSEDDRDALARLFPRAEIWMDYSSTESGKAAVQIRLDRTDHRRSPWRGELGVPDSDTLVRVVDASGVTVPPGTAGEIQLRHAVLPRRRYFPDHRAEADSTDGPWVSTGDIGVLDDTGRLWYSGRLAETANCGGENVSLVEVEQAFLECEFIAAAAAAALPHPLMGQTVGLLLVPVGDRSVTDAELHAFARRRLRPVQRPTRMLCVSEVPVAEHGKIARGKVRDILLDAGAPAAVPESADRILALVRELGFTEAEADDDLFALGLTSLDFVRFAMAIETAFGVMVDLGELMSLATIADLQRHLLPDDGGH